jgi:hypothetical protein
MNPWYLILGTFAGAFTLYLLTIAAYAFYLWFIADPETVGPPLEQNP